MNPKHFIITAAIALSLATIAHAETKTLYYPSEDDAMFSIKAPDGWKVTKIDEVGDFATLENENNSILQFRALELESSDEAKKEIDAISEETGKFLQENYKNIELGDAKEFEVGGQPGVQLLGTGKDKDGNPVKFLSAIIALGPKTIAEIWAAVYTDGDDVDQAGKILGSFKPASK